MAKKMYFYITDNKNKTFKLPINPKEFKIEASTNDTTVNVVRLGEVSILGDEKLKSLEISSILPVKIKDAHYLSTSDVYKNGQTYLDKLEKIYKSKKTMRLVISTTKVNFKGIMSGFTYGMSEGYADEFQFTFKINQYQPHKAIKVKAKKKKVAKKGKSRSKPPKKISRGSKVIVNGRLHLDSAGRGPGQTERNATRKISLIQKGAKYPYHVVTLNGGARGWVKASAVKVV